MKRGLILLLLTAPAFAVGTWTIPQSKRSTACTTSSATCSTTLAGGVGGGTGNVVIVMAGSAANATITIASATIGADNFTLVGATACGIHPASTTATIDCAYIINPTAAGTVVSVTLNAVPSAAWNISVVELQDTSAAAFCAAGTNGLTVTGTSGAGTALTLCGSSDAIVQGWRGNGGTPSAIDTGYAQAYGSYTSNLNGATLINTSTGTAPTWTYTSSKAATNGIAFTDAGGGGAIPTHASPFVITP